MKLANINNQTSFAKNMLAKCSLKSKDTNKRQSATLYSLNPDNNEDAAYLDKNFWIQGSIIHKNFKTDTAASPFKYYVIEDDKTKEAIVLAQTSRRIKPLKNGAMCVSVIDEMMNNKSYINSLEPMIAIITKTAQNQGDENVLTYSRDIYYRCPPDISLCADDTGYSCINKKEYNSLISKAQSRSQIDYFI